MSDKSPACTFFTNSIINVALAAKLERGGLLNLSVGSSLYKEAHFFEGDATGSTPMGAVGVDVIIPILNGNLLPYKKCTALTSIKIIQLNNHKLSDDHMAIFPYILENYPNIKKNLKAIILIGNEFSDSAKTFITDYLKESDITVLFDEPKRGGARRGRRTQKAKAKKATRRR
jgi:hypothetical protein